MVLQGKQRMEMGQKGQSTLEYILLVTAVVVVMLVYMGSGGGFSSSLTNTMKKAVGKLDATAATWAK
jgi:uncharacterized protein (UPF0333 family)